MPSLIEQQFAIQFSETKKFHLPLERLLLTSIFCSRRSTRVNDSPRWRALFPSSCAFFEFSRASRLTKLAGCRVISFATRFLEHVKEENPYIELRLSASWLVPTDRNKYISDILCRPVPDVIKSGHLITAWWKLEKIPHRNVKINNGRYVSGFS